jgi:hypothetical protein
MEPEIPFWFVFIAVFFLVIGSFREGDLKEANNVQG